jgi:7-cyano-7-deazaguanine reductase
MTTRPSKTLETFANPKPERDYQIRFDCPEFTCLCPKTGQPDFAVIRVEYVPDTLCVELKSWKLYLWSYRDEGAFHEAVTNRILDDLVAAVRPRRAQVTGVFNVRGGITTTILATYPNPGASPGPSPSASPGPSASASASPTPGPGSGH